MVVEQRIGRIDRFGQKSDRVHILNLIVKGTVEDRILNRLYERIGIFKESIGPLEAILGEEVQKIQKDYVSGKLTPEEAEQRVEQAARAVEKNRSQIEELEKNAGNLFGHEDYLKDQLKRVDRLGRYISEQAMLAVIESFLQAQHPSVHIWEEPVGVYGLHLSEALRQEIQNASKHDELWVDRGRKGVFAFCFDGERAYQNPTHVELINVSHPFFKAAIAAVSQQLENIHARVAKGVLVLSPGEDEELEEGSYFIQVFSHILKGIRARRVLETIAWSERRKEILPAETGERLLHLVQKQGVEWGTVCPAPVLPSETWQKMKSEAGARNRVMSESEKQENESLYVSRKRLLEAEFQYDRDIKTARLNTARSRGRTRVLPALQGQIEKAERRFRSRYDELEGIRETRCQLSAPIAVCLVKILRSEQ